MKTNELRTPLTASAALSPWFFFSLLPSIPRPHSTKARLSPSFRAVIPAARAICECEQ